MLRGTPINATEIYVNPNAREIFEGSIGEKKFAGISEVVIFRNGTVKTWDVDRKRRLGVMNFEFCPMKRDQPAEP